MDDERALKNKLSSEIGTLMRDKKISEAEELKMRVTNMNNEIDELTKKEENLSNLIKQKMMVIPNIVADTYQLERMTVKMSNYKNLENQ